MAGQTSGGLAAIGDALDKAQPAAKVRDKAKPAAATGDATIDEPEFPILPAGCPVKAIGKHGQVHYFLDEQGQLIALDPQKVGKNHIRSLFGRKSYLCDEYWPRIGQNGAPNGWRPELAGDLLMRAAAFAGIFDPQGRERGRGAHRGANGELVLHCGDTILVAAPDGTGYMEPGLIDGFVYPTAPAQPRPDPVEQDAAPAERLLMLLRSWRWERELIDPMLLLGWVGAAMIGGALGWRPHAWVTGSSATGKSTLQKVLELVFDGAALHTQDATEASLRQLLRQQTLPVFFDELEAEEDNRRAKAVIKLARLASSGAVVFRGGQDHHGHEFKAQACFLFSSILLPPMLAQDRNRLAILELKKFEPGSTAPTIDDREMRLLGRQLRRRLVDHWHRLDPLLEQYRAALAKVGHGGRSQDQFGTLLAIADLLLYDHPDAEVIADTAGWIAAGTLAEKGVDLADEEEALQHLATSFLSGRSGDEPKPVARHIRDALGDNEPARDRLENWGLRLMRGKVDEEGKLSLSPFLGGDPTDVYLAIANSHVRLASLFQGTRWSEGTWTQSFARVDGAHRRHKVRFAAAKGCYSTAIPLGSILDLKAE
jgi:hypothetical protein